MGFRKPMDYNQVRHQIYITGIEILSPHNDGFTTFEMKKDLLKIKWLVDSILNESPTYAGEKEFIENYEKELIWKTLKK